MKNKIKEFLLHLFFPSFCLGCKKEGIYLCDDCKMTLGIIVFIFTSFKPKINFQIKKKNRTVIRFLLAAGGGFEPPVAFTTTVFKTAPFVHSGIPPIYEISS